MKETKLEKDNKLPYSLHDMKINEIQLHENNVTLVFEYGYVETKEPFKQVDGSIMIKNVDYDFCSIYLLSKNGNYGEFLGRKITLKDFIKEYKQYSIEIIDELYGFNQVQYSGYLLLPHKKDLIELSINFYYTGDLIYLTKE